MATVITLPLSPTRAALDAVLATGRLDLIRDQRLRFRLAEWLRQVEVERVHEEIIMQLVAGEVIPFLGSQTSLKTIHEEVFDWIWASSRSPRNPNARAIRADTELIALLAHRRMLTGTIQEIEAGITELQEQILDGLRRELTR